MDTPPSPPPDDIIVITNDFQLDFPEQEEPPTKNIPEPIAIPQTHSHPHPNHPKDKQTETPTENT